MEAPARDDRVTDLLVALDLLLDRGVITEDEHTTYSLNAMSS